MRKHIAICLNLLVLALVITVLVVMCMPLDGHRHWMHRTPWNDPPPQGMMLPPGYSHRTEKGIDSHPGKIWQPGGLEISYDFGLYNAGPSNPRWKDDFQWVREEAVNGETMGIGLRKDGYLNAGFRHDFYFFYAKVNSDEQIGEVLAIVRTFTPPP